MTWEAWAERFRAAAAGLCQGGDCLARGDGRCGRARAVYARDVLHAALSGGVTPSNPRVMLATEYLLTLLFTELLANAAAAALVFAIAHAWTAAAGLHFLPFGVSIAVAASAGFASPLGYQTHLMVYGVGGYRFSDFARIGVPLDLVAMTLMVAIAPLAFPF